MRTQLSLILQVMAVPGGALLSRSINDRFGERVFVLLEVPLGRNLATAWEGAIS